MLKIGIHTLQVFRFFPNDIPRAIFVVLKVQPVLEEQKYVIQMRDHTKMNKNSNS